jgi:hypothetical protein
VRDNSQAALATIAGAVLGGVAGYLLYTGRGRELFRQLEPALDNYSRELNSFRATMAKAAEVAQEGWKLLNEAAGPAFQDSRYSSAHQTSPF